MIHVLAFITAKPGMRDRILAEFRANMPAVHAEKGCVEYQPVVDAIPSVGFATPAGPDTFVVVEKWETLDALQAHSTAPHMAAYGARVKDFIQSRTIHVLSAA